MHSKVNKKTMRIGELAKRSGLSRDTLRFYEKTGLLRPLRDSGNGYRDYGEHSLAQLELVQLCKSLGFSLDEIAEVMQRMAQRPLSCADAEPLIVQKLALVEGRLRELQAQRRALKNRLREVRQNIAEQAAEAALQIPGNKA